MAVNIVSGADIGVSKPAADVLCRRPLLYCFTMAMTAGGTAIVLLDVSFFGSLVKAPW